MNLPTSAQSLNLPIHNFVILVMFFGIMYKLKLKYKLPRWC